MMGLLESGPFLRQRRGSYVFDDFHAFTNAALWTDGGTGGNTAFAVTNADGVNGLLTCNTNAAANNEVWVATTRKNWLGGQTLVGTNQAGGVLVFEARINYQEANTNVAGIFVGFSSAFATGLLAAGAGSLKTNMSAFGVYKLSGSTTWGLISSNGTTQLITLSDKSSVSSNDQILRVEVRTVPGSQVEVSAWLDDLPLLDPSMPFPRPIKHRITDTSLLKMAGGVYVQAGDANAQTLNIDYIGIENLRGFTTP